MQQVGIGAEDRDDGVAITAFDGVLQRGSRGGGSDALLHGRPRGETVFAGDYALRVAQFKGRDRRGRLRRGIELRVRVPGSFESLGASLAPVREQFARFAFGNIEMGRGGS